MERDCIRHQQGRVGPEADECFARSARRTGHHAYGDTSIASVASATRVLSHSTIVSSLAGSTIRSARHRVSRSGPAEPCILVSSGLGSDVHLANLRTARADGSRPALLIPRVSGSSTAGSRDHRTEWQPPVGLSRAGWTRRLSVRRLFGCPTTASTQRPNAHAPINGNSSFQNAPPWDPARSAVTTSAPAWRNASAHLMAFSRKNGSSVPANR